MRDPVLASCRLAPGNGYRVPRVMRVLGGLHYIRGNSSPYFSLTMEAHRVGFPNQCWSGGAAHEEILKRFPKFADLAALHLSGLDGAPMHAESNAWHHYAGATGQRELYRDETGAKCAEYFARHVRVTGEEAAALLAAKMDRAALAAWVEAQRPRWKAEAAACIARHGLRIYGDAWTGPLPEGMAYASPDMARRALEASSAPAEVFQACERAILRAQNAETEAFRREVLADVARELVPFLKAPGGA